MRVALVTINYFPERTGIAVYSTGLAKYLRTSGWDVDVHTAFAYYPAWRKRPQDRARLHRRETIDGVRVRRNYLYVPAKPRAIARMLHEATFAITALASYAFARRADVTIVIAPPLPVALPILALARMRGSRSIVHVQDLQPDAALELGLLRPGLFAQALYTIERWTYRLADRVSSISAAMLERIATKGVMRERLVLFRNWAQERDVVPLPRTTALRVEWGLVDKFVVLYAGNLGRKQGLDALLDAAAASRNDASIAFVIVGEGGEQAALVERAAREQLTNVTFRPLVAPERLSELLASADVSVIPQKAGVTDIVLPSKLANILASARPVIVAAAEESELAQVVRSARCGIVVQQGDGAAIASAVRDLRRSPEHAEQLGASGRAYVEAHLGEQATLRQFEVTLARLAGSLARPEQARASSIR